MEVIRPLQAGLRARFVRNLDFGGIGGYWRLLGDIVCVSPNDPKSWIFVGKNGPIGMKLSESIVLSGSRCGYNVSVI